MPVFCGRDCGGDACPLIAEVVGGKLKALRHNSAAGNYLRACPKGFALGHFHDSPHRLRFPLLRTGPRGSGKFVRIGWDEALDRVVEGLSATRRRHGPQSTICLSSAGSTGALHNTEVLTRRFLNALGGCTELNGSYSSNAGGFALRKVFGSHYPESGFDPATISKSGMIILLGANLLEARLGAELPARLEEAARRGVPVISIDPRKTRTCEGLAAQWLPIRPGSDVALLYAILFELSRRSMVDIDRVQARAEGFSALVDFVQGRVDGLVRDAAWAQRICGLPAPEIISLALRWTSIKPVMLIPGYSIQRTSSGEEAIRLCVALQLATGNFGLPGGSTGGLNNRMPGPRVGRIDEGDGSGNVKVPVLRWPDAIIEGPPSYPSLIRSAYIAGGNLLNQGADITRNRQAFDMLEFAVCHELFMSPTAMHCDIVLPAATPLQKEDIGLPWSGNYLLYKPQVLPREPEVKSDYEIFAALAERLGAGAVFSGGRNEHEWIEHFLSCSEIKDIEDFRMTGIYFGAELERTGLSGFALDPLQHPLGTPSGKVELDGPRWHYGSGNDLLLVTPKAALRVHSQGGDRPSSIFDNRLSMNPDDASARGCAAGDRVSIRSSTGRTAARLVLSDRIMKGVVSLEEGSWCLEPFAATELPGSANHLTSTEGTRESTSCIMHGIPVMVGKEEP